MSDFLFEHFIQLKKEILKSNSIFLFLDYDGTLMPFKDRPKQVKTPEKIKKIIRLLIKNPKIKVIIVTGRSLQDIKKLLRIQGLFFIALHGLYIETINGLQFNCKQADQVRLLIKVIKDDLDREVKKEKGVILEDKELTIVLHYRLLPISRINFVRKKFKNIVQLEDKKKILEIINGAKVIEARPKGWNKGKAIEMFLASYNSIKNKLPIYIGDDKTDEDAFRFIGQRGITIYVANKSKRKTTARYKVKNYEDVFFFLQSIYNLLNPR